MNTLRATIVVLACTAAPLAAQTKADYQATVTGQSPNHYFKLDGTLDSAASAVVLTIAPGHAGGYTSDAYQNASNAYFFANQLDSLDSSDPLVSGGGVSNINATAKGSITFLFRTLSGVNSGQSYLFSAGGVTSNANALSLFIENDDQTNDVSLNNALRLRFGDDTFTILSASNMPYSTWHYFALTYDLARAPGKAIWYVGQVGGALTSGTTSNSAESVAGGGVSFVIGNKNDGTFESGFRNPGNGRIDEFAVWQSELSAAQISNQFSKLPVPPLGELVTRTVVDDTFADGNRTNTGPLQADWWSSSSTNGNSIEVYTNQLGLISGTSGRGIHGTFAPQMLGIGDTIRATYTFTTPATVTAIGTSTSLKVALMDFNDPGLAADLSSASASVNPLYTNLPGYMADYDVNLGTTADIGIREHIVPNTSGRFLGTTGEWLSLGGSPDAGYAFTTNTEYVGVFSVTRTDTDSVDVFTSLRQGTNVMDSFSAGDSTGTANHFGMLGFWVNSATFGSTTTAGQTEDNGITFSKVKVEIVTLAPILSITTSSGNAILSWSSSFTGYALESTTNLPSGPWADAGTPTVLGGLNYVTNSVSGNGAYYRLVKP